MLALGYLQILRSFFINPSSVLTVVRPMYDDSVICIVDDDGKCISSSI